MRLVTSAVVLSMVLTASAASAAPIVQPLSNSTISINARTFGQSFMADDPVLGTVEILYTDFNEVLGPADIVIDVFAGVGYGGTLLGSVSRDLAGLSGLQSFGFGGLTTVVGNLYSFRVSSASGRGAVDINQHSFPGGGAINVDYAGGDLLTGASGIPDTLFDMRFAINNGRATVPEPATLALLGVGMIVTGLRRRRRAPRRA